MGTEIIVALIGATSVVTVAVINSRQSKKTNRKLDAVAEDAAAARDQVQNTHKTNMRHDLDVIRDEMRDGFARLSRDTTEIRADQALIHGQIAQLNSSDMDARREHASLWDALRKLGKAA